MGGVAGGAGGETGLTLASIAADEYVRWPTPGPPVPSHAPITVVLAHFDDLFAGGLRKLTRREAEVLPLLQQGRSNAQIALALGVGVETVRTHARNVYRKLGVRTRRELAVPLAL